MYRHSNIPSQKFDLVLTQTFKHQSLEKLAYSFNHDKYLLHIPGMALDSRDLGLSILQMVKRKNMILPVVINIQ